MESFLLAPTDSSTTPNAIKSLSSSVAPSFFPCHVHASTWFVFPPANFGTILRSLRVACGELVRPANATRSDTLNPTRGEPSGAPEHASRAFWDGESTARAG